jgi:hypothetical protein
MEKYNKLTDREKNEPILIHSDLTVVDENKTIINRSFMKYSNISKNVYETYYFVQNNVTGCTILINQKLKEYIFINEELLNASLKDIPMHDWFLGLVAYKFGLIIYIDKPTVYYRQHPNNTIGAKNVRSIKYLLKRVFNKEVYKNNLYNSIGLTSIFIKLYKGIIDSKSYDVLLKYVNIKRYNKIDRIFFIFKYNLLEDNLIRIIGEIFYI